MEKVVTWNYMTCKGLYAAAALAASARAGKRTWRTCAYKHRFLRARTFILDVPVFSHSGRCPVRDGRSRWRFVSRMFGVGADHVISREEPRESLEYVHPGASLTIHSRGFVELASHPPHLF